MSPIESMLLSGIVFLGGIIGLLYRSQEAARKTAEEKQEVARAAAHAETRERIDELETHVEECNEERGTFRVKIARLEERQTRFERCPKPDCPVRTP